MEQSNESLSTASPEYLAFKKSYEVLANTVKAQTGAICNALFARGHITESVRDFTRSRSVLEEEKAHKLVDTVCDRVKLNPSVFHDFSSIMESEPSCKDACKLLQIRFQEELEHATEQQSVVCNDEQEQLESINGRDTFVCPFCKECTVQKFFTKPGCSKRQPSVESSALFPYIDVTGLDENDIMNLEDRLITETTEIVTKFADFTVNVRKSFQERAVPLDEFKDSVLSLEAFTEDLGIYVLEKSEKEKIFAAKSISEIFTILRIHNYMSFFHYHIIEHLIKHHGSPDDQASLEHYLTELKTFSQRNVFEVPPSVFSRKSQNNGKVFALKCIDKVAKLEEVQVIKRMVANIFGLNTSALQLCSIRKGCVELYFLISARVADRIFPVSPSRQAALNEIAAHILSCEEVTDNNIDVCNSQGMELSSAIDESIQQSFQWEKKPAIHSPPSNLPLLYSIEESKVTVSSPNYTYIPHSSSRRPSNESQDSGWQSRSSSMDSNWPATDTHITDDFPRGLSNTDETQLDKLNPHIVRHTKNHENLCQAPHQQKKLIPSPLVNNASQVLTGESMIPTIHRSCSVHPPVKHNTVQPPKRFHSYEPGCQTVSTGPTPSNVPKRSLKGQLLRSALMKSASDVFTAHVQEEPTATHADDKMTPN